MTDATIADKLMAAACGDSTPQDEQPECAEYDWSAPHSLGADGRARLAEISASMASELSRALGKVLRIEIAFSAGDMQERYGSDARTKAQATAGYHLGLTLGDGRPAGMLSASASVAAQWVGSLLGGSGADESREMSQLEQTVLADVMKAAGAALCSVLGADGGPVLTHADALRTEVGDIIGLDSDEYCSIAINQADAPDQTVLTVLLASSLAGALTAGQSSGAGGSAEEDSKVMLEHVGATAITASVRVGWAKASVRDLAALEVGDVLVLTQKAGDPAEMLVRDVVLAKGHLAETEGNYALQISETFAADN